MDKRIQLEIRRKSPSQIKELVLDNCRSTSIEGLTDDFVNLECLSLINVGLTNLKGFPKLPNLKKLELSDNRISAGLDNLKGCPKLTHLNLGGNKISTINILEPLKEFKELKFLELYNCEVTSMEDYREKLFALIPSLKVLDGTYQDNEEYDEEDETDGNGFKDGDSDLNDEDEDGDEDLSDEDEEDDEVGLSYLQNSIDEESEGDDYNPDGAEDSDVDIEDDADEDDNPRGQKRKLEE